MPGGAGFARTPGTAGSAWAPLLAQLTGNWTSAASTTATSRRSRQARTMAHGPQARSAVTTLPNSPQCKRGVAS